MRFRLIGLSYRLSAVRCQLRQIAAEAGQSLKRVLGVPDYEAYLAHVAQAHPTATPLSRDEFVSRRLSERYSKPGARCC